jgi:hypothetical protein
MFYLFKTRYILTYNYLVFINCNIFLKNNCIHIYKYIICFLLQVIQAIMDEHQSKVARMSSSAAGPGDVASHAEWFGPDEDDTAAAGDIELEMDLSAMTPKTPMTARPVPQQVCNVILVQVVHAHLKICLC